MRFRHDGTGIGSGFPNRQSGPLESIISCGDLSPAYLKHLCGIFKVTLYYVRGDHDILYVDKQPVGCTNLYSKIDLTRDLLSSDGEIISNYVYDQLREIQGGLSTQTLIPGRSLIREPADSSK